MEVELVVKGGKELSSYGGGGGRPSEVAGEFVLFRRIVFSDGEKSPRGPGNRGLPVKGPCGHGCGVFPVPNVYGVSPVAGNGQKPVGVYGGCP